MTDLRVTPAPWCWGLWLQWIFVTLIGFLASLYWLEVGGRPDLNAIDGAIGGAVIGVAQWWVIRQKIPNAWLWILISIACWSILGISHIGVVGWIAPSTSNLLIRMGYGVLNGIQVGLLMGTTQWLTFRKSIPKAQRWILMSAIGWGLGLALGWSLGEILHRWTGIFLGEVMGLTLGWITVAVVTGSALVRHSIPKVHST